MFKELFTKDIIDKSERYTEKEEKEKQKEKTKNNTNYKKTTKRKRENTIPEGQEYPGMLRKDLRKLENFPIFQNTGSVRANLSHKSNLDTVSKTLEFISDVVSSEFSKSILRT